MAGTEVGAKKAHRQGEDASNLKQAKLLIQEANVLEEWVDAAGTVPQKLESAEVLTKLINKIKKLSSALSKLAAIPDTTDVAHPTELFDHIDTASRCVVGGLAYCRDTFKAVSKDKWDDPASMVGIACNFGLIEAAIQCLKALPKRKTLCATVLLCLGSIALCRPVMRDYILGETAADLTAVFKKHKGDVSISTNAMKLARILCSNSVSRQETLVQAGALPRIVRCTEEHLRIATIQAESARLMGNMAAFNGALTLYDTNSCISDIFNVRRKPSRPSCDHWSCQAVSRSTVSTQRRRTGCGVDMRSPS